MSAHWPVNERKRLFSTSIIVKSLLYEELQTQFVQPHCGKCAKRPQWDTQESTDVTLDEQADHVQI
jgi:hypothetical protein